MSYVPRRTSTPIALCVIFRVAVIFNLHALTWAFATLSPYKSTLSYLIRSVSTKISTKRRILQNQSRGDWRYREQFKNLRLSFQGTATVGIQECERSLLLSGPPGSRSQRLRIKRNFPSVVVRRSRCACPLFSRNRVVLSRSRLVVLRKYEAYPDLEVRNLLGEFQDRIATVRVRAHVGPPTPAVSQTIDVRYALGRSWQAS